METNQMVVVVGNPFDGIAIYGPIDVNDEVGEENNDWRHTLKDEDWWIVDLRPVPKREG